MKNHLSTRSIFSLVFGIAFLLAALALYMTGSDILALSSAIVGITLLFNAWGTRNTPNDTMDDNSDDGYE